MSYHTPSSGSPSIADQVMQRVRESARETEKLNAYLDIRAKYYGLLAQHDLESVNISYPEGTIEERTKALKQRIEVLSKMK